MIGQTQDLELHLDPDQGELLDPGPDDEAIAESKRAFEVHVRGRHEPAIPLFLELGHGHFIATLHLVETGGEHIVHVATAVHVLIHVDIVRPNLQLRFKFRIDELRVNRGSISGGRNRVVHKRESARGRRSGSKEKAPGKTGAAPTPRTPQEDRLNSCRSQERIRSFS